MGLIAISDVHGCSETLAALLKKVEPQPDDQLVFVGDYIDRGPNSRGVIERVIELNETHDCVFLRGNHEAMMLEYLQTGAFALWSRNGGQETLLSYGNSIAGVDIPDEHVQFLKQTKLYYETDEFLFVHAGLKPHRTVAENLDIGDEETFLWERSHMDADELAWEKTVVCGHTPIPEPVSKDKLLAIDTGCVYHQRPGLGRLAAVRLPERDFTFVPYQG